MHSAGIPQANLIAKRALDIFVIIIVSPFVVPFLLMCVLFIFLEHILIGRPFDPLFYKESRVSHNCIFSLYKLNIFDQRVINEMRRNYIFIHTKELEKNGSITFVGYLLKQIYMDELPQLFNVFTGDMAIVGPRPLNEEVFRGLDDKHVATQAYIKAGITGNFQSHKNTKGAKSFTLDHEYFEKLKTYSPIQIVLLDIKIMIRTIKVLLLAKGV